MKKDVIYIDIEDDITAIIGKVKDAKAKIVALVPPKRVGVLQSIVNLKLLQKAADNADKRVVLITNDKSLVALAAGVSLPVAKNLQTKPEIPDVPALEVDDIDVINGEDMPVGDLAKTAGLAGAAGMVLGSPKTTGVDAAAEAAGAALDEPDLDVSVAGGESKTTKPKTKKTGPKIPNFDSFRKRLFLISTAGAIVLVFLIWAIFFAPRATVTITAKTNAVSVNKGLVLDPSKETDIDSAQLKPIVKQVKKSASTDFKATGRKDIGDKATGKVVFSNCETSYAQTVPAGTVLRQNGLDYTLDADVTVPGGVFAPGCASAGTSPAVSITASDVGPEYNTSSGTDFDVSGHSTSFSATSSTAISGGTKETITVVSQDDVDQALKDLEKDQTNNKTAAMDQLKDGFGSQDIIIDDSFNADQAKPSVTPAVGEKADQASLTVETTYTLVAVKSDDLKAVVGDELNKSIDNPDSEQIYDYGIDKIKFSQFEAGAHDVYTVTVSATGQIGPKLDVNSIKSQVAGKRTGDIQQTVGAIDGVNDVKVDFWPFWVSHAPKNADKIQVKFSVSS